MCLGSFPGIIQGNEKNGGKWRADVSDERNDVVLYNCTIKPYGYMSTAKKENCGGYFCCSPDLFCPSHPGIDIWPTKCYLVNRQHFVGQK